MKTVHTYAAQQLPVEGRSANIKHYAGPCVQKISPSHNCASEPHVQCFKSPKQIHLIPLKYRFGKDVRLSQIFLTKLRLFHGFHYAVWGAQKPYLLLVFSPSLMGLFFVTSSSSSLEQLAICLHKSNGEFGQGGEKSKDSLSAIYKHCHYKQVTLNHAMGRQQRGSKFDIMKSLCESTYIFLGALAAYLQDELRF